MRLGELDTKTNLCDNGGICSEPQDYAIDSIVHHSNYDSPKYANDIAIIRLQRTVNLGMFHVRIYYYIVFPFQLLLLL